VTRKDREDWEELLALRSTYNGLVAYGVPPEMADRLMTALIHGVFDA